MKNVLSVGESFSYEYDFGSTTNLLLNVHSYRIGENNPKKKIVILSRNIHRKYFVTNVGQAERSG